MSTMRERTYSPRPFAWAPTSRGRYAFPQQPVHHNVERTQVGQLEPLYAQLRSLRAEQPAQPLDG